MTFAIGGLNMQKLAQRIHIYREHDRLAHFASLRFCDRKQTPHHFKHRIPHFTVSRLDRSIVTCMLPRQNCSKGIPIAARFTLVIQLSSLADTRHGQPLKQSFRPVNRTIKAITSRMAQQPTQRIRWAGRRVRGSGALYCGLWDV
jgi:hypothetical protein